MHMMSEDMMITGSSYMCNVHSLFVLDKEHHVSSYIAYFIAYHNIHE